VLGDFLPRNLVEQSCRAISEEKKSRFGSPVKKLTSDVILLKKTFDGPSIEVDFSQEQLREWANFFGMPRLDLHASRVKRLGKHLILFPSARV
jgi:hypothetical protein